IIALTQPDIKRILAYSTISQLGFMMAGLGCGGVVVATAGEHAGHPELLKLGFTAGMFHLMTHAFFKGLLFLGSGSVIHGTGTQDIWEMGGLKRFMPKTFWTYFIGYIALAGVPGTAGFFSKDLILDAAWEFNRPIFGVLVFSAFLTAFYMTRQMMVVFSGQWSGGPAVVHHGHTSPTSDPHGSLHAEDATGVGHEQEEKPTPQADHDHGAHAAQAVHAPAHADDKTAHSSHDAHGAHGHHGEPHESPAVMWIPLAFLAALALLSGWVGIPGQVQIYQYLHYTRPDFAEPFHAHVNPVVIGSGTAAGFLGIFLGILAYRGRQFAPFRGRAVSPMAQRIYGLSYNKMYFDELYWNVLIVPMFIVTRALRLIDIWLVDGLVKGVGWLGLGLAVLWGLVDRHLVDGLVNGVGRGARLGGNGLRYLQSGQIQNYVLVVFAGIIILTWALVQSYLFR
ncbi:MAG TPA: proton-conducting transporter membrane subunit, partial [Armatimonadota bacterium]|nr:proton-conducting transporter membrane subunit [Armatimonadota bacterium]